MPELNCRFCAQRSVIAVLLIPAVVCLATGFAHSATLSFTTYTTANGLGNNSVNGVFASGNAIYAATAGGLSISTNGGVSFTNYTTANGLGSNAVRDVFASGSAIYAATGSGLSISTNGGVSFTNYTTASGLGSNNVVSVYADGAAVYAATSGSGVSISINGGINWTKYSTANGLLGNNVNDVFSASGVIYAAGWGLSTSANGGGNWASIISSDTVYCVYASGSNVYAGSKAGGLRISNDYGTTWTNFTTANGLGSNDPFGVYAIGSTIYAAASGVSVSANGGASWTNYTTANGLGSDRVRGVFADDNYVYSATTNGLSIAAVPEPSTYAMALAGIAFGGYSMWRRRKRVERLRRSLVAASLVLMAVFLASGPADAGPISIEWVTVGDSGNAADTSPSGFGAVADAFRIMKYEFTNSQYIEFLNAVDPNGTNLYSVYDALMGSNARGGITNTGTINGSLYAVKANMGDKPVNYVSWFNAARVANWLQNGQGSGSTETGAYTLLGGQTSGTTPERNPNAQLYIPLDDQWYKAAYYKGGGTTAGYWNYATQSDITPAAVTSGLNGIGSAGSSGNFANFMSTADWNGQNGNVTTVGTNGGPSAYGAFDMNGNGLEWIDPTGTTGSSGMFRGGGWMAKPVNLSSSLSAYYAWGLEDAVGFRLASPVAVPEPSTYAMALAGLACGGYSMLRRRKRA